MSPCGYDSKEGRNRERCVGICCAWIDGRKLEIRLREGGREEGREGGGEQERQRTGTEGRRLHGAIIIIIRPLSLGSDWLKDRFGGGGGGGGGETN